MQLTSISFPEYVLPSTQPACGERGSPNHDAAARTCPLQPPTCPSLLRSDRTPEAQQRPPCVAGGESAAQHFPQSRPRGGELASCPLRSQFVRVVRVRAR